jgi:phosphopantetheine adenylyltransferase
MSIDESVGLSSFDKMMGGQKAAYNMGKKHGAKGVRINAEKSFGVNAPYYELGHKHGSEERSDSDAWHEKQSSGRRTSYHESSDPYPVGSKVRVRLGGMWHDGEVTKGPHPKTGNIEVKFQHGKKKFKTLFDPATEVKPVQENAKTLSFKEYLIESTIPHDLFIGRFQPFHKGHAAVIESMNNPVVVIIRGAKSSTDKEKNPLTVEQQEQLIKTEFPKIPVFVSNDSGFVPAVVGLVEGKGYKVSRVFAGSDRIEDYKGQVARANKKIDSGVDVDHKPILIQFVETPRVTSATKVRNVIRANNFDEYRELMSSKLATEQVFEELKRHMSNIT